MPILLLAGHIVFLVVALFASGVVPVRKRDVEAKEDRYRRIVKIVGLGLLFVVYIVVPIPIRIMGGSAGFDVVFLLLFGWVGLLFWTGVCVLWWRVMECLLKLMIADKRLWGLLMLLPVVLIGGRAIYRSWPSVRAACVLYNAELAPLPPSASELKVNLWFTPMSGEGCLRFRAAPDDIERFLATSPILRDVEYAKCSEGQDRFFYPRDARYPTSLEDLQRYVSREGGMPPWVIKDFTGSMTGYRIDPLGSQVSGAVIVDEASHLVFVRLSFD